MMTMRTVRAMTNTSPRHIHSSSTGEMSLEPIFTLSLHLEQVVHRHHVRIQMAHDPERTRNDERDDEDAEGKRQHVVGIVRTGTDVQKEYQVNSHLRDGEYGQSGRYSRRPQQIGLRHDEGRRREQQCESKP